MFYLNGLLRKCYIHAAAIGVCCVSKRMFKVGVYKELEMYVDELSIG